MSIRRYLPISVSTVCAENLNKVRKPRNAFEKAIDKRLKKHKAGAKYEAVKLPYLLESTWLVDWVTKKGIHIEGKGYFRPANMRMMRAIRKQYPDLDILLVFYEPNKKIKNSKTTYSQWAEKNGFRWCTLETLADAI